MLVVACQVCKEVEILVGMPDSDGVARPQWTCPHCGAGQILQLPISADVRQGDMHRILGGLSVSKDGQYIPVSPAHDV